MTTNKKLMDDVIALSGNIMSNLLGGRHEFKAQAKQRFDQIAQQLNLVSREEFDAAFAMLAKARAMQDELDERLSAVEKLLKVSSAKQSVKTTKLNLPSVKKVAAKGKRK